MNLPTLPAGFRWEIVPFLSGEMAWIRIYNFQKVMERSAGLNEIVTTASYMARDLNTLLEMGIKI